MSRNPTYRGDAWMWWSAHQGRLDAPRTAEPQCGLFRIKRGGQWRPAWIDLHAPLDPETGELVGDEILVAAVDGRPADPADIWLSVDPVTEAEFHRLQRARKVRDLTRSIVT